MASELKCSFRVTSGPSWPMGPCAHVAVDPWVRGLDRAHGHRPHGIPTHEDWSADVIGIEPALRSLVEVQTPEAEVEDETEDATFEDVLALLKILCRTKAICDRWSNYYYSCNFFARRGVVAAMHGSTVNKDFIMSFFVEIIPHQFWEKLLRLIQLDYLSLIQAEESLAPCDPADLDAEFLVKLISKQLADSSARQHQLVAILPTDSSTWACGVPVGVPLGRTTTW